MKRMIFTSVLFLVLAGLIVPKFVGDVAQDVYRQGFDNYPLDGTDATIEHKSYVQSWFSSTAVTVLTIPIGMPNMTSIEWVMTSKVQHGPILLTDDGVKFGIAYIDSKSTFEGLPKEAQDFLDEHLGSDGIRISSLIDFKQLSHDSMNIKGFSFEEGKAAVTFGGLALAGTTPLDYSDMKGKVKLPASQIVGEDFALHIADAWATYKQYNYKNMMMLGDAAIHFPLIEAVSNQGNLSLEDFSIDVKESEQDGKLNLVENIVVKSITAPVPLTAFQYNIEIQKLDLSALKGWSDLLKDQQKNNKTPKMDEAQVYALLDAVLQQELALNQRLKLEGMGGELSIDWDAKFLGFSKGVHAKDIKDKQQILEALDMHILLQVDKVVVNATPFAAMVSPYIEQGFIVEQGDKLVADIVLIKGMVTVNKLEVPMASILPLLKGQAAPSGGQSSQGSASF